MHDFAYSWFAMKLEELPPPPPMRVLEIGSRDVNGTLRSLFAERQQKPVYLGIDIVRGRGVDVVACGEGYVPPWPMDLVFCAEVLEHVPDATAKGICQNALKMLEPGGVLLMSMATDPREPHSAGDSAPLQPGEFYRNVRVDQLRDWLEGFAGVQWFKHAHGDLYVKAVKGKK
jgi:hypothetical protein